MATAVQLKRPHRKERFGSDNYILCGKSEKIVTSPNGRANILDAAIAREDTKLLDRIRSLDNVDDLSYHMDNKCFKSCSEKDDGQNSEGKMCPFHRLYIHNVIMG